tara:strand:- start:174 stop:875 length:702 start_codon:yes stop_codon:yes gene_type:complete
MLRSIFIFVFYVGVIIISLVFLPALLMPQKITLIGGKLMGVWCKICLKYLLSVKIEIKGEENIIRDEKFFIACTHQSAFETYYLQVIYNGPVFILKKELTKIPIFGWYLKKIGSVAVDRNKISRDNLAFMTKIQEHYKINNRPVVIFPQGTRMEMHDRSDFKKGVKRIYDELKIKCQPVVMNSGSIWPKKGKIGTKKSLVISILKPIEPGQDSEDFLKNLQKNIYNELENISN